MRWDIRRDDAPGPDHGARPNRHPWQHQRASTDPRAVPNGDRPRKGAIRRSPGATGGGVHQTLGGRERMRHRQQLDRRADKDVRANLNRRRVQKHAIHVHERVRADRNVNAIITAKGRLDPDPLTFYPDV